MPQGDKTGPQGQGPMTGRAAGYCAGFNAPGYTNSMPGRGIGLGCGRGFGRGFRRMAFMQQPVKQEPLELSKEQKLKILEADKAEVEAELEEIKKRLKELNK